MFGDATRRFLIAVVIATTLVGCSDSVGPDEGLNDARARWTQVGPLSYTMTIQRSCSECQDVHRGPVRIEVRNGVVQTKTYAKSGAEVAPLFTSTFPTVEELFLQIDLSIRRGDRLGVQYDHYYGYPKRFEPEAGFDEWAYTITEFTPR
jgi:hypothetical protein